MHHFVAEMYTFLLQSGALWDIRLVHGEICAIGLLFTPSLADAQWLSIVHTLFAAPRNEKNHNVASN